MDDRDAGGVPLCVIAIWTVEPARAHEVEALLGELAPRSLAEPGCRKFDVWQTPERPGRFVLVEEYVDEAARTAHRGTDHFRRLVLDGAVPLGVERDVFAYVPLPTTPAARS